MNTLPKVDEEKLLEASMKSAETRRRRVELKARLKSGAIGIEEFMDRPDAQRIKVVNMIRQFKYYGKERALKLMAKMGIHSGRRVKGLGRRQREALIEKFGGAK